jgi:60 kDa SS-A/Ro ribonucleoprotein
MPDALSAIRTRNAETPQAERADERQVPNSAGGYSFRVSQETRLRRFLVLGTDGGTYYASEHALTKDNAAVVLEAARNDGCALAQLIEEISLAGRAPRQNPALFALAAVAGLGNEEARRIAFAALPRVARTGSHLLTWAAYVEQFRGWGRGLARAVGQWYLARDPDQIAYQCLKYQQRNGWSQRDLMRLASLGTRGDLHQEMTPQQRLLITYLRTGRRGDGELPALVDAIAKAHETRSVPEWTRLVEGNRSLSWEMLPSEALASRNVWEALLWHNLPLGAMIRNLGRMTRLGVLTPGGQGTAKVAARLADMSQLKKARIHPVNVLVALRTYSSGHGARGQDSWQPVSKITDALDAAFYAAFGTVEPAGARTLLGIDVSGSMTNAVSGLPLECREAASALAMVMAATEPSCISMAFTHRFQPLDISPRRRLDDVINAVSGMNFGATDCSLPMLYALKEKIPVDHFSVFTDNETWAGRMHPHQALEQYRQKTGINARLSVVGMTATDFTIADPADPGSMDVAGFDSAAPTLLTDFARGSL